MKKHKVETITVTVPLFIRLLELAREDVVSDVELHEITERAQKLGGVMNMKDYEYLAGSNKGGQ
jgi:hypothetical protein